MLRAEKVLLAVTSTAAAMIAASASAVLSAVPAQAALTYTPCEESNQYACASLTVPLDPSGRMPGTVTLAIHRHLAPTGPHTSAVIALAGGPGQAALPFTEEETSLLGPILATRDLIAFDQRGTGRSGPLSCHAFEDTGQLRSPGAVVAECARQLGPQRSLYTSADSVADIEAIRVAGGYEKLVLYGTSYGTKVAELYAEAHPSRVEALVLDSVVTPNGPDPLNRSTFAAVPRVLAGLCTSGACSHVTTNPLADLAHVLRRAGHGSFPVRVIGPHGRVTRAPVTADRLFSLLVAGDLAPQLRAELLTADRSAALGDDAMLGRLLVHAQQSEAAEAEPFDAPLYYATTCEELPFPWRQTSSPAQRFSEARAAADALPASDTVPFSSQTMLDFGSLEECADWPAPAAAAASPTAPEAPLPDVPTLILSGAEDLRTPLANAQAVAAAIPDAQLLVVPQTGHSVLGAEPSECAHEALLAFFEAKPLRACHAAHLPASLLPPPLPPLRVAALSTIRGYRNRAGRTLHGVGLTFAALDSELVLTLTDELISHTSGGLGPVAVGGLRSGWARYDKSRITLHRYSYIPGLTLSGSLGPNGLRLRIGGRGALHGTLRNGWGTMLLGRLGGRRVDVSSKAISASATASAATARTASAAAGAGTGIAGIAGPTRDPYAVVRRLERILGLR